jgi:hypothetical protein
LLLFSTMGSRLLGGRCLREGCWVVYGWMCTSGDSKTTICPGSIVVNVNIFTLIVYIIQMPQFWFVSTHRKRPSPLAIPLQPPNRLLHDSNIPSLDQVKKSGDCVYTYEERRKGFHFYHFSEPDTIFKPSSTATNTLHFSSHLGAPDRSESRPTTRPASPGPPRAPPAGPPRPASPPRRTP